MNKLNYISGITIHQHKTFLGFLFGRDNVIKAIKDKNNYSFKFLLNVEPTDKITGLITAYESYFKGITIRIIDEMDERNR